MPPLSGMGVGRTTSKRRQAVGRYDQQMLVIDRINVTHLALTQTLQGMQIRLEKRVHLSFNSFANAG